MAQVNEQGFLTAYQYWFGCYYPSNEDTAMTAEVLWGRTAQCAAGLPVGAQIALAGRLQSRGYVKVLPEGAEERTAYELSAMELEILEENF